MAIDLAEFKATFLGWCDKRIADYEAQIAPLKGGNKTGDCGPHTDFKWVDTTAATIQRLENDIASVKSLKERWNA